MYDVTEAVFQSPPLDLTGPVDPSGLAGKTVVITGGASGVGAAMARRWAAHGAHLIVGDVADEAGAALAAELRAATGSPHHHYARVDVASWPSQAAFFEEAVRLSPHGGIDAVVANAGSRGGPGGQFLEPEAHQEETDGGGDDDDHPAALPRPVAPDTRAIEVNVTGVAYTAYLALFWLPRNPGSSGVPGGGGVGGRDRHLLLVGSIASLMALPGAPLYAASKHAVLGLFRSIRGTAWRSGVRVNLLCPYFLHTPMVPALARGALLAGTAAGQPEDAADAATRLMADRSVAGRAVAVARRVRVRGGGAEEQFEVLAMAEEGGGGDGNDDGDDDQPEGGGDGVVCSAWEVFPSDMQTVEAFVYRFVRMLHAVQRIRGWAGWAHDVVDAVKLWMGWSGGRRVARETRPERY